jgi:hypothetical protein
MYYIDTPSAQIDAMDFNAGEVSNRRAVVKGFDFETTGFPDGSLAYGEEMVFFGELWPKVLGEISRNSTKIAMLNSYVGPMGVLLRHWNWMELGPHPVSTSGVQLTLRSGLGVLLESNVDVHV